MLSQGLGAKAPKSRAIKRLGLKKLPNARSHMDMLANMSVLDITLKTSKVWMASLVLTLVTCQLRA